MHKFLSKTNDPKIVTERLKKDIIKLVIDEVRIEDEGIDQSIKIFATISLPTKIHQREVEKTDEPDTINAGATLGPINRTKMERIWNKHKTNSPLKRKVFVGVSGGVDSSVSLALLKDQGYDVTGVFLKVWSPDFLPCDWREERRSAMRVCATLGVPFLTLDCEREYKEEVVDYMLREYSEGRVPNPDVFCNKYVKFGIFLKKALELGADFVATGHYARKVESRKLKVESEIQYELHEAEDKNKDQSYFIYTLNQDQLKRTLFPVGYLTKPEVRELARKFSLPTAEKKDSQGLCFIGKVDMKEFLEHFIQKQEGQVLNTKGEVIGRHDGAVFFAIGQRHGFQIIKKTSEDPRYFVVSKDMMANTITVASKDFENDRVYSNKKVILKNMHFINGQNPTFPLKTSVRIRYRQEKQTCVVEKGGQDYTVHFNTPQDGISIGQSAVFYEGEICLGGGIIESVA